jgi:pimeloyl-ACP methyl ester carboxylesterase
VFYYWLGAVLPERLGQAVLRSKVIVRVMSETMAKTRDPELRAFIHDQHDQYFSRFATRDSLLQSFRASVSHDVYEYAAGFTMPTLLIAAEKDDISSVAAQRRLHTAIPSSVLVVIPEVGHLIHYETTVQAADQILAFLPVSG